MKPGMTLTLAIETSNPGGESGSSGVCLARCGPGAAADVLARRTLEPASRHDDALMPAIDRACRDAGVTPGDIGCVAVSLGPGGYTSLRIGVTAAKMIALSTGAMLVGVPTATAVVRRASPPDATMPVHVLLAWKRGSAWREVFDPAYQQRGAGGLVPLERAASDAVGAHLVADPALVGQLAGTLPAGVSTEPPRFDPVATAEASVGLDATEPARLVPLYPREPEAVTNWRILKGG